MFIKIYFLFRIELSTAKVWIHLGGTPYIFQVLLIITVVSSTHCEICSLEKSPPDVVFPFNLDIFVRRKLPVCVSTWNPAPVHRVSVNSGRAVLSQLSMVRLGLPPVPVSLLLEPPLRDHAEGTVPKLLGWWKSCSHCAV